MGAGVCCPCRSHEPDRNSLLRGEHNEARHGGRGGRVAINVGDLDKPKPIDIEATWKSGVDGVWNSKPSKSAANTDIPRLVRKFSIIDQNGHDITPKLGVPPVVAPKADQKANPAIGDDPRVREDEVIVLNFLMALSTALNDNDTRDHLEQHFWDFFPRQEMSGPLRAWLVDIEERFEDDPITLKVLKLASQRVMIPSFWCVKTKLGVGLMLDKRGSWRIEFRLREGGGVDVVHIKTHILDNRSRSPEQDTFSGSPEVEFDLNLHMKVDFATVEGDRLSAVYIEVGNVQPCNAEVSEQIVDYWRRKVASVPRIE